MSQKFVSLIFLSDTTQLFCCVTSVTIEILVRKVNKHRDITHFDVWLFTKQFDQLTNLLFQFSRNVYISEFQLNLIIASDILKTC